MTFILYILLTYYLIQLTKSESLTNKLLNKISDSLKEGEEKKDNDKMLSGCLGVYLVLLPSAMIKLVLNIFLIYLIINGIKSVELFYPSIVMAVVYLFNFVYAQIANVVKRKKNKEKKDKYSHVKTKRSVRGWISLILILIYIIWYLIVI